MRGGLWSGRPLYQYGMYMGGLVGGAARTKVNWSRQVIAVK